MVCKVTVATQVGQGEMVAFTLSRAKSPIVGAASTITIRRSGESVGSGILAIDQGTSGTKALVVDADGDVLSVVEMPVSLHVLGDGGVEQDPNELLASVLAVGRRAIEESRIDVVAVGVANQGETVLAWDRRTGEALSPAISWQDRRSAVVVERLSAHAQRLAEISGLSLDPYFTAPKLRWLRA